MPTNEKLLAARIEFKWVKRSVRTLPTEPSLIGFHTFIMHEQIKYDEQLKKETIVCTILILFG